MYQIKGTALASSFFQTKKHPRAYPLKLRVAMERYHHKNYMDIGIFKNKGWKETKENEKGVIVKKQSTVKYVKSFILRGLTLSFFHSLHVTFWSLMSFLCGQTLAFYCFTQTYLSKASACGSWNIQSTPNHTLKYRKILKYLAFYLKLKCSCFFSSPWSKSSLFLLELPTEVLLFPKASSVLRNWIGDKSGDLIPLFIWCTW